MNNAELNNAEMITEPSPDHSDLDKQIEVYLKELGIVE